VSERHPDAEAVLTMEAAILAEFNRTYPQDERSQRIKRVARAIAIANRQGDYLDRIVMGFPSNTPGSGIAYCGKGTVAILFPLQPCWATYVHDAIAAIEACDAANEEDSEMAMGLR
jgi:hypothetical protein